MRISWNRHIALCLMGALALSACKKKDDDDEDDDSTPTVASNGGGTTPTTTTTSTTTSTLALDFGGTVTTTESSSEGAALTESERTLTCQIQGNDASAVSTTVDSEGGFTFAAADVKAFPGNVVECKVVDSEGNSIDLPTVSVPSDAVTADVTGTVDDDSGAANSEAEFVKANGSAVTNDEVYAALPADLMAFDPSGITGVYNRKNCQIDRSENKDGLHAIRKGSRDEVGVDTASCNGWEQQGLYLIGTKGVVGSAVPLVKDTPPTVEAWNNLKDYEACNASGALNMNISDGTHAFDLGDGKGIDAAQVFDQIVAGGWAPQVALDRAAKAMNEEAPADPQSAQIREILLQHYSEPCVGLGNDLAISWEAAAGFEKRGGRAICVGLTYTAGPAEIVDMLNQEIAENAGNSNGDGGGMLSDCGEYKRAKTDEGKTKALNRWIGMCNDYIAGKPGHHEEQRAKLEIVDSFLRSIGDLKWQFGDSRFEPLKRALKGLDLDDASSISDEALLALASEWASVSWDFRLRQQLQYAKDNFATTISSAEQWLAVNGMTGKQVIVASLASSSSARQNLDELVCADAYGIPSLKDMVGEASLTALEAKLAAPSQANNFMSSWNDSSLTLADKKTLLLAFIDAFLAKEIEHCERIRLTANRQQINNYTGSGPNANFNPTDNFPQFMLGHQLLEAKSRKVLEEIGTLLAGNPTYAQLLAQAQALASFRPGGHDYISEQLERRAQEGADENGLRFQLIQMLGGEAARSAFRYDAAYLAKQKLIKENSACLPDAKVSWQPEFDAAGNETIPVKVSGPVRQTFKAPLSLKGDFVSAVDTRVENGGSCYFGNVMGLTSIPKAAFEGNVGFESPYMMAWFNGCGGDSNESSSESATTGDFGVATFSVPTEE